MKTSEMLWTVGLVLVALIVYEFVVKGLAYQVQAAITKKAA